MWVRRRIAVLGRNEGSIVGTVTKLVRSIRAQDHPILSAMKMAPRFEELDVSHVDWNALSTDLAIDVASFKAADEIGDAGRLANRLKRTRDLQLAVENVKKLYEADRDDDRRISKHFPFPGPDLLAVLSNLEGAVQQALESLRSTARLQQSGDPTFIELTDPKFLYAVTERMAQTFETHFKVEAKPYTRRNESPRRDGPFLRMAQFALREYGDEEYKLSSIATELDKIRAKATKKPKTVPATHAKSR